MKRFGSLPVPCVPVSALLVALVGLALLAPVTEAADIVGRGSVGGSLGGMKFLSGSDFGNGNVRFIGQAVFKYNFTGHLAGEVESGWGWNAYPGATNDTDTLATVIPTIFGLEYRWNPTGGRIWPHVGGGGGFYSLGVKDTYRTWAYAKNGTERLTWTSLGLYGKVGAEYLFPNAVSINLDFLYHTIFSKDTSRFPDKWGNQNTSFAEFRLGANYYFTLKGYSPAPSKED
jgi:hypothetical protein